MVRVFSPISGNIHGVGRFVVGLSLAAVLFIGGCASVPPPDSAMNQAQSQLQAARDAQAQDYAPVDLGFAQDKFQQAQAAMAERKYAVAATLAAEAQADAELAAAKGRLGAARAEIQRKVDENSRLRARGEAASAGAGNAVDGSEDAPVVPADVGQGNLPTPPAAPAAGGGFQPVAPAAAAPAAAGSSAQPGLGGFQPVPAPAQSTDAPAASAPLAAIRATPAATDGGRI